LFNTKSVTKLGDLTVPIPKVMDQNTQNLRHLPVIGMLTADFFLTLLYFSDAALLEMKAQALIQAKYLVCIVFTVQTHFLQFMSSYGYFLRDKIFCCSAP
jgi:hypothetical protein